MTLHPTIDSRLKNKSGFTIIELLVTISILGILASIGLRSMIDFYEQRRLRSAAIEVIGMIQEKRAQVMAEQLTASNACMSLDTSDSASPIRNDKGMTSGVIGLEVKTEAGGTPLPLCFTPEGLAYTTNGSSKDLLGTPLTLVLSSPAVASQGDWCVVVLPLLAQPHLDWRPRGQASCRLDSAQGSF